TYFDLVRFFPDGAFAEDASARSTIACRALELARRLGPVADDGVFVIGDTPHDIECARAIDARTIAVATGGYPLEELRLPALARLPPGAALVPRARGRVSGLVRDSERQHRGVARGPRCGAGRPSCPDGHRDWLLCPRGHARERSGRGADVSRRRRARAALR